MQWQFCTFFPCFCFWAWAFRSSYTLGCGCTVLPPASYCLLCFWHGVCGHFTGVEPYFRLVLVEILHLFLYRFNLFALFVWFGRKLRAFMSFFLWALRLWFVFSFFVLLVQGSLILPGCFSVGLIHLFSLGFYVLLSECMFCP